MPKEPTTKSSSGFSLALDTRVLNRAKAPIDANEQRKGIGPLVDFPIQSVSKQTERGIPSGEQANIHRQVILTESAAKELDQFVFEITTSLKCRGLTTSHIVRSLIRAMKHSHDYIIHEISKNGPQKMPSNARGFEQERDNLEEKISAAILRGFRDSPAPEIE
jgi:hypothetical protein